MVIKSNIYSVGSSEVIDKEFILDEIKFKIHKFNNKVKSIQNSVIIPCFGEFGCETFSCVYCLPRYLRRLDGKYVIVVGWEGRKYLYEHLVDEFWEISPDAMYLREYSRAFNNVSKNLSKLQEKLSQFGKVVPSGVLSNLAVFPKLDRCFVDGGKVINQVCFKCGRIYQESGFFENVKKSKKQAVWLPEVDKQKLLKVKSYLPKKAVGITARNRKTWGRNFDISFYEKLIILLEKLGYNPVWMGEKVSSLKCPFSRILDYSSLEDSKDLEMTFALVSQMEFTIQYWTASSRIAGLLGVPFIIFESPDQIWEYQEGYRLNLTSKGPYKRVLCDYKASINDPNSILDLTEKAVIEISNKNYHDIIGLVDSYDYVIYLKDKFGDKIGDNIRIC